MFYKLDENKEPVPCLLEEWGQQLKDMHMSNTKHVGNDIIGNKEISTVWIGLDHDFEQTGIPLLFETMIFEGEDLADIYCRRYSTWKEAEEGHKKAIQWVKDGCKDE